MVAGGSAQTFHGLLAYIDRCPPNLVMYESVDSMDEGSGLTNVDILLSEFSSRGYEGQRMTLDAHSFGLPQHRRRMWVLFVRVVANSRVTCVDRQIDQVFVTVCACVSACQRAAPCAPFNAWLALSFQAVSFVAWHLARDGSSSQGPW